MSDSPRFFLTEQQQDLEINKKLRTAESTYFRYKKQMSGEVLAGILSKLVHSLDLDSSAHFNAQLRSFSLFLWLCDQYKELLPEDYRSFGVSENICASCLIIKNSPLFERLQSEHDRISYLLEKNKPSGPEEQIRSIYNCSLSHS